MKIKKNELIIVFVLVYLFVAICGWNFLIRPQSNRASELSDQLKAKETEKITSDQKVKSIPNIEKKIQETIDQINQLSGNFFPKTANPELHIDNLFGMERSAGVKLVSLDVVAVDDEDLSDEFIQNSGNDSTANASAQDTTTEQVDAEGNAANAEQADNTVTAAKADDNVYTNPVLKKLSVTKATITINGSMFDIIEFADKIQLRKNVIEFQAVSVEQDEESNGYNATYSLSFVSAVDNK